MMHEWNIASRGMALFANANRDPSKCSAFHPRDFNPMLPQRGLGVIRTLGDLKMLFVALKGAKHGRR